MTNHDTAAGVDGVGRGRWRKERSEFNAKGASVAKGDASAGRKRRKRGDMICHADVYNLRKNENDFQSFKTFNYRRFKCPN